MPIKNAIRTLLIFQVIFVSSAQHAMTYATVTRALYLEWSLRIQNCKYTKGTKLNAEIINSHKYLVHGHCSMAEIYPALNR